ncbi:MAG: hypothetical protein IIT88_00730, partial [Acetobacter sp.]|nr:hypothetical protein [Acetobacter sp.]
MPEINLILQKERNRRALILNIFGAILFLITFFFSVFGMLVYGISLYIAVPLGLASSVFGLVLATTFLVSRFFGFYLSLRPVEKDPFNPINKAIDLKEDTRIAVMMPIYHEDVRRVAGAFFAMIEELSHYKEAKHFEWFILSDSRKEDVIVQEQKAVFLLKEKFPDVGIHY